MHLRYLHTMVRVADLDKSMHFYNLLGLKVTRRYDNEKGRFSLVFMAAKVKKIHLLSLHIIGMETINFQVIVVILATSLMKLKISIKFASTYRKMEL